MIEEGFSRMFDRTAALRQQINDDLDAIVRMAPSITKEDVWVRVTSTIYPNGAVVRALRERMFALHRPWLTFSHQEAIDIMDEFFRGHSRPLLW